MVNYCAKPKPYFPRMIHVPMKKLFIIAIVFSSIFSSCIKSRDCARTDYSFEGFFKAYPDRDSIRIGDTIWLETKIPVITKDVVSGKEINYSGAVNLGTAIRYLELISGLGDPAPLYSANFFNNILVEGRATASVDENRVREFLFVEEGGFYLFKLAIIPTKRGLFAIGPSDAANVYTKSNKCGKSFFSLTFKDTNQRVFLYEQTRPSYTASGYERSHIYVFKVY